MRLGVVLTGTGVSGAAGAGVLCELWRRQMEPYAVCGLGTGAWAAALFASGADAQRMEECAAVAGRMGKRMLRANRGFAGRCEGAVFNTAAMERLLTVQTGGRALPLCPRKAVFPLRIAGSKRRAVFSTQSFAVERNTALAMQSTAAFAARAAMGMPPFAAPVMWMGHALLPDYSEQYGAALLMALGAQRILAVETAMEPACTADALAMTAFHAGSSGRELPDGAARLVIRAFPDEGMLDFARITDWFRRGKETAACELDRLLVDMGMASCRVLPFAPVR